MIQASTIASVAKAAIAANPKFQSITPELDALVTAIANGVATAVNAELTVMKTLYNSHTHVTAVGPTAPPLPPMT
jgi:hypothetical protein